jgi:hypothetical protein
MIRFNRNRSDRVIASQHPLRGAAPASPACRVRPRKHRHQDRHRSGTDRDSHALPEQANRMVGIPGGAEETVAASVSLIRSSAAEILAGILGRA